jgi:hypothetical protein
MVDALLWSLAVGLAVMAAWLARPRPQSWEIASFFAVSWAVLRRPAPLPLTDGPVPEGGWSGRSEDLGEEYDPARLLNDMTTALPRLFATKVTTSRCARPAFGSRTYGRANNAGCG